MELSHIWWRHVCILVVDVFFYIIEGAVFAQMWLFAHCESKLFAEIVCTFVVVNTFQFSQLQKLARLSIHSRILPANDITTNIPGWNFKQ